MKISKAPRQIPRPPFEKGHINKDALPAGERLVAKNPLLRGLLKRTYDSLVEKYKDHCAHFIADSFHKELKAKGIDPETILQEIKSIDEFNATVKNLSDVSPKLVSSIKKRLKLGLFSHDVGTGTAKTTPKGAGQTAATPKRGLFSRSVETKK